MREEDIAVSSKPQTVYEQISERLKGGMMVESDYHLSM